jgi:Ca-activated chloride channel family protein
MLKTFKRLTTASVLAGLLVGCGHYANGQSSYLPTSNQATYKLDVSVDEVVLTFHATRANGVPVKDLRLDELSLLDNGSGPGRILSFQLLQNFPVRGGILLDTSSSMQENLSLNRAIAMKYAWQLLRQQSDQAFVMKFGRTSNVVQPWTGASTELSAGIGKTGEDHLRGTAIFDAILSACLYEFGKIDHAASGNFILLFSDGEDNASFTYLRDAVDMCQRSNTAIYAVRTDSTAMPDSTGPGTLAELASETGGRVFRYSASAGEVDRDVQAIEADLRTQYRLVYKPADLKHNGSFHRIALHTPERVDNVVIRSGYYAPAH